jgi:hypothetical protein
MLLGIDWYHVPEKFGFIEQTKPCILKTEVGNRGYQAYNKNDDEQNVSQFCPFSLRPFRHLRRSLSEIVPDLGDQP